MSQSGLSPRTVRVAHIVRSTALKHGVRLGRLRFNPAYGAELLKQQRREMVYFSEDEAQAFLKKASEDSRSLIFTLAVGKLQQHKRRQAEERLRLGAEYQNLDLVFAAADGGPIHQNNLNARNFKDICKRAELNSKATLYTLRHTCATMLLLACENPKVVSERLGHSSVTVTLDIYSHVVPTMQQGATANLAQRLYAVAQ